MRVGLDGFAIPGRPLDPFETLAWVSEQGLDGYFFGLLTRVSPTLDAGYLGELRARADDLGLYLEVGIGTVNPTHVATSPAALALRDDQFRPGFERLLLPRGRRTRDARSRFPLDAPFGAVDQRRVGAPGGGTALVLQESRDHPTAARARNRTSPATSGSLRFGPASMSNVSKLVNV